MDENLMSAPQSGLWKGYYNYMAGSVRHRQVLDLKFTNGCISGDGSDGVGIFLIAGRYHEDGEVNWTKSYPGSHQVAYRGFYEKRSIWGTWAIRGTVSRGGFRIWPAGEEEDEIAEVEAEVEQLLQV